MASAGGPRGSPRVAVVFLLWQCDKENHGWCEGPPVTVLCQSFRSAGRAFTLRLNQFRTKKEYSFTRPPTSLSLEHWPVIDDDPPGAEPGCTNSTTYPLKQRRPRQRSGSVDV